MVKTKFSALGKWAALLGLLLAAGIGLLEAFQLWDVTPVEAQVSIFLVVVGIIVGLFNVKGAESVPFMVAAVVFAGGAIALAVLPMVGSAVQTVFARIATLVAPAALTVAAKVLYSKGAR